MREVLKMAKAIVYPTQEWIDNWMDKYMDEHPDERIEDFDALREDAESAWWDIQVDKGNPTPYDQTPEQKAASKAAMQGMARSVNAYGKTVERKRKPNEDKRAIMNALMSAMESWHHDEESAVANATNFDLSNIERQIDFVLNGISYSVTLTAHRPPKK
jgi:hypothetical protein